MTGDAYILVMQSVGMTSLLNSGYEELYVLGYLGDTTCSFIQ